MMWRKKALFVAGVIVMAAIAFVGVYAVMANRGTEAEERSAEAEEGSGVGTPGFWNVTSLEEASQIAGYPIATPAFLSEGFRKGTYIMVTEREFNLPMTVMQTWAWQEDTSVYLTLIQDPIARGIGGGEAAEVCGVPGQRALTPAYGRPHARLSLFWRDDNMGYVLGGSLAGPLTEETLQKIAASVRIE